MRRKAELFALSLLCADLWDSWEGESENSIDVFSPRMFTKKSKEHESGWVLGRVRLVRQVGLVRKVRESKLSTPPYGGDGGGPIFPQQKSPRAVRHVGRMNDYLDLAYFLSR